MATTRKARERLCKDTRPRSSTSMHANHGFDDLDYDDLLRWVPTWVMLEQAKLMLVHLSHAPSQWPENAIYAHGAISAIRSVTFFLQTEFKHDAGFDDWYAD